MQRGMHLSYLRRFAFSHVELCLSVSAFPQERVCGIFVCLSLSYCFRIVVGILVRCVYEWCSIECFAC